MNKGFTLVEILVVMAIVAIAGLILVTIFTNTLRGSNKSQILAVIKQNGQSVLEQMDKTVRNADNVVCVSNDNPSTSLVIVKNGIYTRFRFIIKTSTTNGSIQQDNPTQSSSETLPQFITRVCQYTDPMVSANILTDTNSQTGVSINSGFFAPSPLPGYKTAVTTYFKLWAGTEAPSAIAGQIDPVEFKTTIGLR